MRMIYLIAMRELMENMKTKGFWVGVLMVPLMMLVVTFAMGRLAQSTPSRHYILVDQSGEYRDAVQTAMDRGHQRRILQAFGNYIQDNLAQRPQTDFTRPAPANDALQQILSDDQEAALERWLDNGGLESALATARPRLREDAPAFVPPGPRLVQVPLPAGIDANAPPEQIIESLRPYLNGDRPYLYQGERTPLFAAVLIPRNIDEAVVRPGFSTGDPGEGGVQYWAVNLTDNDLPEAIERSINQVIRNNEFASRGVDASLVATVQRTRMPIRKLDPSKVAGEEEVSIADTIQQFLPVGFVYIMFFTLLMSTQLLLNNTIEEKSNRIIEVLLASVTPNEIMLGKLTGIGLSCFTMVGTWIVALLVFLNLFSTPQTENLSELLDVLVSTPLIPYFIFYFISGYVLFAGIILAIGSICDTIKEAQNFMTPVVLLLVTPTITMMFIVQDPNGTLARVMSWIPPFTPFVMMNRAAASPPLVDLVGTALLLVVCIVLLLGLMGRIFRQGILRTGQPPRLVELYRMLTARE